jgi:excisionase family DNA binding protein
MDAPMLLTVTQAAKLMGFSRDTFYKLLRSFEIPYIPRGRKGRRIARADIEKWIEAHKVRNQDQLRKALDGRRKS